MPTESTRIWRVAEGSVHIYRLFDLGEAIDLSHAERLLAAPRSRLRLEAAQSMTALEIPRPPLQVALGRRALPLASGPREGYCDACFTGEYLVQFPQSRPTAPLRLVGG